MTALLLPMQNLHDQSIGYHPRDDSRRSRGILANIAPRNQRSSSENSDSPKMVLKTHVTSTKPKLPPRSRLGCWTCRTRKVKCDEAKPQCTPCVRLRQECDYNPRVSFKDDTPRIRFKMARSVNKPGPAWDPEAASVVEQVSREDFLPLFASLTNDEDRESKAKRRRPGTYYVVCNPSSFAMYEEYRDTVASRSSLKPSSRSTSRDPTMELFFEEDRSSRDQSEILSQVSEDPNVVILRVFEDDTKDTDSPLIKSGRLRSSQTPISNHEHVRPKIKDEESAETVARASPLMKSIEPQSEDTLLIQHFKSVVHNQLAHIHNDSMGETSPLTPSLPDLLESHAAKFRPLYHALMCFCAASMSSKKGHHTLDVAALQHYQQTIPSLKSCLRAESDLASDGVFLTHFVLLLYEISAGENSELSLRSEHLSQLSRIVSLRRKRFQTDPFESVIWCIANIDTQLVLLGMGSGDFIGTVLRHGFLNTTLDLSRNSPTIHQSLEKPVPGSHASILDYHHRVCLLGGELGLLAQALRAEDVDKTSPRHSTLFMERHRRIASVQEALRQTWQLQRAANAVNRYGRNAPPGSENGIFRHTTALYHALMIFSHTSMYPSQRLSRPHVTPEVRQSYVQIAELARAIVSAEQYECKFMIFPLLMAGTVSPSAEERAEILELVKALEQGCIGKNVTATRRLLETYFYRTTAIASPDRAKDKRQKQKGVASNDDAIALEAEDWIGLIRETGLQVVNCRL